MAVPTLYMQLLAHRSNCDSLLNRNMGSLLLRCRSLARCAAGRFPLVDGSEILSTDGLCARSSALKPLGKVDRSKALPSNGRKWPLTSPDDIPASGHYPLITAKAGFSGLLLVWG